MSGTLKVALTGDSLVAGPVPPPEAAGARELASTLSDCDVMFTNLETPINDGLGWPTCRDTGTWCSATSEHLRALRGLGFNLFACANNHSLDWAEPGLLYTRQAIEDQGGVCAGIGPSLSEARRPGLLATANGTVALVSMSATFPMAWRAGDARGDVPARAGLNPLGHKLEYSVSEDLWPHLHRLNEVLGLDAHHRRRLRIGYAIEDSESEVLHLLGSRFLKGGDRSSARHMVDPLDGQANLRAVAEARDRAGLVIVSIHSHEMGPGGELEPVAFLPDFARRCIDEGADIVVSHGPHLLRGIEVYRGKPIFYSLGNFFFQNELNGLQPQEYYEKYGLDASATADELFDKRSATGGYPGDRRYWETVAVRCHFDGADLREVVLIPVGLGFGLPRDHRGVPTLALGDNAERILAALDDLCIPFGTGVRFDDEYGALCW